MADKELISVRLETDTKQRVDRYADEHDVSRSVAIRRLLDKGIDFEEAGLAVASSNQTDRTIPDGGQLEETQNQVQEVSKDIDSLNRQLNNSILLLVVGILWIGIELTIGIPLEPIGTIVSGLLLVLWALYPRVRQV